jgi:hypothetical protein
MKSIRVNVSELLCSACVRAERSSSGLEQDKQVIARKAVSADESFTLRPLLPGRYTVCISTVGTKQHNSLSPFFTRCELRPAASWFDLVTRPDGPACVGRTLRLSR